MSWDKRYMQLAQFVAQWSKDPNRKVGAVVTEDNYVKGVGFNGFPRGVADTPSRLGDKEIKNLLMVHAEVNALSHAGGSGDTIYVWPLLPCTRCMGEIIQYRIRRLVVMPLRLDSKWNQDLVMSLADEAGVEIDSLEWEDI